MENFVSDEKGCDLAQVAIAARSLSLVRLPARLLETAHLGFGPGLVGVDRACLIRVTLA